MFKSKPLRLRKDSYQVQHFDRRFLKKLLQMGPVGPRMKPRIKVPWHEQNPSLVTEEQNVLHLYRLAYARDHFQLADYAAAREKSFESRPVTQLRLSDNAPDWKKHVLMSFYQVAEDHPKWSAGQKDDVLTAVFRMLKNNALWDKWGVSLNYDMLSDDDPFKPAPKFAADGVTRISLNTPDVDAPILDPLREPAPPPPPTVLGKIKPNRAARLAASGGKGRRYDPSRFKRKKPAMAKFRATTRFKLKKYEQKK